MKKLSKVIGIIFLLLVVIAIIPIFIPDEEYTISAKQWLDDANSPEVVPDELNRFNAVVGFYVEEGKDIVAEGAELIKEENTRLENIYDSGGTFTKNDYWNNRPIKANSQQIKLLNDIFRANPTKWLSDNYIEYETLLSDNQTIINRYRQLMSIET